MKNQTILDAFLSREVQKLTGVPAQTLHHWAKTGFVVPSIRDGKGPGSRRLYSFKDVLALRVARRLRDEGIPMSKLRRVVSHLRDKKGVENPLAEAFLVVKGDDVVIECGDKAFSVLKNPGQGYLGFSLSITREVEEIRDWIKMNVA